MTYMHPKNLSEREAREMEALADQLMRTGDIYSGWRCQVCSQSKIVSPYFIEPDRCECCGERRKSQGESHAAEK